MQVYFLTQSGAGLPSVRFRVLPFVKLGKEAGLQVAWQRIPKSIFTRTLNLLRTPVSEAIVVQKKLLQPLYLKLLRRRCQRLYYDLDDAVWTNHPGATDQPGAAARQEKNRKRFAVTCRAVMGVIAGNRFLAAKAAPHQPNITVLPTPIDTAAYRPRERETPPSGVLRVGWMGTAANQHFLPPALNSLGTSSQAIEIRMISNENRLGDIGAHVRFEPWSAETEIAQLQGFDIGLMPLTDDDYTRGKCGFKLLQYMACGVVPVASAVGFNAEIIDHGENGFLVRRESDWGRFVWRLQADPDLRRRMAAKAREKIVTRFDLKPSAERLWRALGVQTAPIRSR
jgi:glycosyltransferase involved in cell wall biosynthesis